MGDQWSGLIHHTPRLPSMGLGLASPGSRTGSCKEPSWKSRECETVKAICPASIYTPPAACQGADEIIFVLNYYYDSTNFAESQENLQKNNRGHYPEDIRAQSIPVNQCELCYNGVNKRGRR
jgi:hypothetical protein